MAADENFYPASFRYDFDVHYRHFNRYFEVIKLLGKCGMDERWLDCACGSGYGTRLLGEFCTHVTGFDINDRAIAYAQETYGTENVSFTTDSSPFDPDSFDTIISIETIEHMMPDNGRKLLTDMHRWLKPEGSLIITTPIVPKSNPDPVNPFHCYEYDRQEFEAMLAECGFAIVIRRSERVMFTDGELKEQSFFSCVPAIS